MRARPEHTQSEDLSDASFLGKLLVLPENVRPDWKVFARYKHSSFLALSSAMKKKSFIRLPPEEPFEEAGAVGEVLETVDTGGPAEPFEHGRGRLVLASPHCRNGDLGPDSQYNIF